MTELELLQLLATGGRVIRRRSFGGRFGKFYIPELITKTGFSTRRAAEAAIKAWQEDALRRWNNMFEGIDHAGH